MKYSVVDDYVPRRLPSSQPEREHIITSLVGLVDECHGSYLNSSHGVNSLESM